MDVADGIGQDRSVCDVFRMGTLEECEEQVAQFISDRVPPRQFAGVIDAIGHLYSGADGREALAAIECNNHGLSVQDTLQLHLGYRHFYIWEVLDQADPQKRWTTKMGWVTTTRTRPLLLDQLYTGITTIDPISGYSECRLNSPFTLDEMRDFKTDGQLWEAEAAKGAHDDCLPPDTLIRTRTGVKPIVQVQVGDEVLTHAGRFRPVTRVGCRPVTQVYDLTITGRPALTVTENHQLLVCFRQPRWGRPAGDGGTAGLRLHDLPEWRAIDAGEPLTNFAATAVAPMEVRPQAQVDLLAYAPATYNVIAHHLVAFTHGGTRENPNQNRPPATIAVDADWCRLLGYYYAEGSRGRHTVAWAGHRDETHIRAWLLDYLHRLGLVPSVVTTSAKGVCVSVGAVPLNRFFADFGSRDQKQFPEWVTLLPPLLQQHLLGGWLLGDGCFRNTDGGISAVTISTFGAAQLYEMAIRCGWPCTLRRQAAQTHVHYPQWVFTFTARTAALIRATLPPALLADKRPIITERLVNRDKLKLVHGYLVGHIQRVTPRAYTGLVYNLEVAEDHSYVANGTVVHNCLIAAGIAHFVCWRLAGGEVEPLADRRRRRQDEELRRLRAGVLTPADFRNSDATLDAQRRQEGLTLADRQDHQLEEDDDGQFYFDPDSRGQGGTLY